VAWFWLPETVHRAQAGTGLPFRSLPAMLRRPGLRRMLVIDFVYWFAFAIFQTTFALFTARRFQFDASQTGYCFAAFGILGAVVQGGFIRPVVRRLGDKSTFIVGLTCSAIGLVAATLAHSVAVFVVTLVPLALGIGFGHPTVSSLVSRAARDDEQGRVQGAASAVESLGRTVGPVWGNASLQRWGAGTPYLSAAALLMLTLWMCAGYHLTDAEAGIDLAPDSA
jgi:predicted MFS family arabinose efflux permease